ncbi:FAD-binding and (Fe-S)-binding domain-containing protein [Pleurocapsa sp. PCC 7319]|uniref:FAD-binding and (Fe-S)-binding domain-containing protein n=1 Tax=Pleurocapsa sp. PCC 7319 TaxID=118161 RepID=UPI0004770C11
MIPRLPLRDTLETDVDRFLQALECTDFSGEIRADFASRLLSSTDNSIYQILPQAVVFPKTAADIVTIFQLANQPAFQRLTFSPRGGGTGTNGQSLSTGIILDCSKYMNQILEVNLEAGWVKVQPGVVLDSLNNHLKPYGVFFAPNLSPSSRATLGGMINTDACGIGSHIYGRTSDHILELTWVLTDGTTASSYPVSVKDLAQLKVQGGRIGQIYRQVDEIVTTKESLIEQQFPKMPRFLTGYNLAKVYDPERQFFDLNRILAGSEGTLAVVTAAKLKLTPIPRFKKLLVIHYACFDHALNASQSLLAFNPAAIETIDETILDLAKQDEIYDRVKDFIKDARAINLVEFVSDDTTQLQATVEQLQQELNSHSAQQAIGYYQTSSPGEIASLWKLRKRGVGLLGNRPGQRKPIAFIEDTAVPPANLPAYIKEFKELLNEYQLDYAMFGHVDVGCLHVRPALNLQVPQDEALIRTISDRIVTLVRKYGGVMWAEHGRGFRSEYTALFFGEELYQDLRKIKAAFDPHNRLNPGKIVTPFDSEEQVATLEAPLRGHYDRQVPTAIQTDYEVAFSCNGNGACFNVNPDYVMCPSYKGSLERIHSPKGRASLLREWLRQLALSQERDLDRPGKVLVKFWNTLTKTIGQYDYSHEVYDGLHGCLSCKACANQCPIHVDIPSLKSKFLQRYYTRYLRSPRDYLMGYIEYLTQWQGKFPTITNLVMQNPFTQRLLQSGLGIISPQPVSEVTMRTALQSRNVQFSNLEQLAKAEPSNSVFLLPDLFTSVYETSLILATYDLFTQLGLQVYVLPPLVSGKPLHVLGFLDKFAVVARENIAYLNTLQEFNIPIVGIEPSMVLTYRDEYANFEGGAALNIQLLQEFLGDQSVLLKGRGFANRFPPSQRPSSYTLLGHCSEKVLAPASQQQWQEVFQSAGLQLNILETGCCGMAGIYGYEAEHLATSRDIYQLSWDQHLPSDPNTRVNYLATGFSCRTQVKRFAGWLPLHPIQALQQELKKI